ncbi:MAG TPA: ABC transporter ATP-binding protein [Acidimicrobiia bacterium]|nr:ABC transporter ATP-binding protein [Acidimicrobiia bacterium]
MEVTIRGLGKVYSSRAGGEVIALEGVSTSIRSGDFVTLIGPSGCGKSTLLDIVAGLIPKTSGEVTIDGIAVEGTSPSRVGLVFQRAVLLPWRTAIENVYLPAQLGVDPPSKLQGDELRGRARELLDLVGLGHFAEKYPWELSGGMQQRVAIARALLLETKVMCMDEPFAALDEFTREQMHLELLRLWERQGFTGIFVTHNIFEGAFLSDRVLVMTPRPGKVVAEVAIDLPRPRTKEMIGTAGFTDNVRRIRDAMAEHWTG